MNHVPLRPDMGQHTFLRCLLARPFFIFLFLSVASAVNAQQYANTVISESNVTSSPNSIDANRSTYSELEAGTGVIIGIGSYSAHIEMQFPTVVPANQTSYVRIETQDNILSSLMGGTLGNLLSGINGTALIGNQEFSVEAKIGSTAVLSGNSTNPASFSGERLKVVVDTNSHTYLAITPSQPYQSIRISNFVGSLVPLGAKKHLKVWDAYYLEQGASCATPQFTSYDAIGVTLELLNLGGGAHNLQRTIDGNLSSYSMLGLGVVSTASSITQRVYFEGVSQPTDIFAVRLQMDPALLAITMGQGVRIRTQNGAIVMTNGPLNNLLAPEDISALQDGRPATLYITPNAPVDRLVVELNGLLGVTAAQQLEILEVYRLVPPPVLDTENSELATYTGRTAILVADAVSPTHEIRWYTDQTATTPIGVAPSGETFTTGLLTADTVLYMAAAVPGCPNESLRVPVAISVLPPPVISTGTMPDAVAATYGSVSASSSFTVSGENMVAGITVTAPDGFAVSLDDDSFVGSVFIEVPAASKDIPETDVYFRLEGGLTVGNYTGDIELSSTDVEEEKLGVSGTVAPRSLSVIADAGQGKVYGDADMALTFTATGFAGTDDESLLSGALARLPGEAVGNYAIDKGTLSANSNYTVSYTGAEFVVSPRTLSVKADAGQGKVYGDIDTALTFTATGFADTDDETLLSGALSRVPGETVGSYAIDQGTLSANSNYTVFYAGADFVVSPRELIITANSQSKTYGEELDFEGTEFKAQGLKGDDTVTSVTITSTGTSAGAIVDTYPINLAVAKGTGLENYVVTYKSGLLTVIPAQIEGVQLKDTLHIYDGTPKSLALTGVLPAGVVVNYTINGSAGNSAADVGKYAVMAAISGSNYLPVTYEAVLAIVSPQIQIQGVEDGGIYSSGLTVVFSGGTATLNGQPFHSGMTISEEGSHLLIVSYASNNSDTVRFTIDKTAPSIAGVEDGGVYNTGVKVTFDEGTALLDGNPFISGTPIDKEGTYQLIVTDAAGNIRRVAFTVGSLSEPPLTLSASAGNKHVTLSWQPPVGGILPATNYTIQYSLDDGREWITANQATSAATRAIIIGLTNNRPYLFRMAADNALGQGAFSGTVSAIPTDPIPNEEGVLPNLAPGDIVVITDGQVEVVNLEVVDEEYLRLEGNDYVMELASLGMDGERIPIRDVDAVIRLIRRAGSEIYLRGNGFEPGTVISFYLFSAPELIGHIPVGADGRFEGTLAVPIHLPAGNHTLQANGIVAGGQGSRSISVGVQLVDRNPQWIDFTLPHERVYGESPLELMATSTSGLPVAYAVTGPDGEETDIATIENGNMLYVRRAGAFYVTAAQGGSVDYSDANPVVKEVVVSPAPLIVRATDTVKPFGEVDPLFSYTYSGLVNDDTDQVLSGSLARTAGEEVGTYPIGQGNVSAGQNYTIHFVGSSLIITPVARNISFPKLPEKIYGDADFAPGAISSNGEDLIYVSSDERVAIIANGLIRITGAGTATITARAPENHNYANHPDVSQTLVVAKAAQAITLNIPAEVNRDAGTVAITATSSSGLPVTLSIDNPEIAALDGTMLNILRLGTVRVSAKQVGDANHEAAEPVTAVIRVVDPTSDFPVRVHPALSPNGDGINEYLIIEGIQDYPENRVSVINRNGTVVWEGSGYDNDRMVFRGIGAGQQQLPAGTYFYLVEVNDRGIMKYEKGYFVLRY